MLYRGELVGVLVVEELDHNPRHFTEEDVHLLSLFAGQAAASVHNTRLLAETQQRLAELEAVNRISGALRVARTLDEMLPILVDETLVVLNTTAGQIAFFESAGAEQRASVQRGWFAETPRTASMGDGIAGRVFETGKAYVTRDFKSDSLTSERARAQIPSGWGGALLPLRVGSDIIGVLALAVQEPRELTSNEVRLLATLADIAGNAIHRMRLYQETLEYGNELRLAYDRTIEGWSHALDLRDEETEGHTQRVTEVTLQLARAMGMSDEELVHVRRGALLHDIGKMGIPDRILLKPGPLSEEERFIMQLHPQYAFDLLEPIAYLRPALAIPYCHHERWNGTGYPQGLKGEEIPLAARIFAIVDVWDALRSNRPYRLAWPERLVREHLESNAGVYFDPRVVELFRQLINAG